MSERMISVHEKAHMAGVTASNRSLPKETGGILVGWRTPNGIHVVDFLEISSRRSTRSLYIRSKPKANSVLRRYIKNLPSKTSVGYVGEWHSHPLPQPASTTDFASMTEFAKNDGQPLALIVLSRHTEYWVLTSWYAFKSCRRTVRIELAKSAIVND